MLALLGGATLEQEMSEREFERAGLDKLTEEELAFLNDYLGREAISPADAFGREQVDTMPARSRPAPVAEAEAAESKAVESAAEQRRSIRSRIGRIIGGRDRQQHVQAIHSRIKGEFRGWDGQTLFVLENGQQWRQRLSSVYRHRASNPEVTIAKGRFGYYLIVDKTKRRVGVKRVR